MHSQQTLWMGLALLEFETWISNITEVMDSDPDETVCYLRTELYELLDNMKELKYSSSCVDEFAKWMETTCDNEAHAQIQIQKLLRQKDRMSNLKTRLIEKP